MRGFLVQTYLLEIVTSTQMVENFKYFLINLINLI